MQDKFPFYIVAPDKKKIASHIFITSKPFSYFNKSPYHRYICLFQSIGIYAIHKNGDKHPNFFKYFEIS